MQEYSSINMHKWMPQETNNYINLFFSILFSKLYINFSNSHISQNYLELIIA